MINRKRKLLPVLAAVSLMLAGLSGCGLKGDLYMPDRPHAEQTTSQQSGR